MKVILVHDRVVSYPLVKNLLVRQSKFIIHFSSIFSPNFTPFRPFTHHFEYSFFFLSFFLLNIRMIDYVKGRMHFIYLPDEERSCCRMKKKHPYNHFKGIFSLLRALSLLSSLSLYYPSSFFYRTTTNQLLPLLTKDFLSIMS